MFSFKKKSLLNCSDQTIMRKWRELLDKLEGRKNLLSGFKNTMNMFREIENIQEELKEIEVRSPAVLLLIWQNRSKFWNFMGFFCYFHFILNESPVSFVPKSKLWRIKRLWEYVKSFEEKKWCCAWYNRQKKNIINT